MRELILKRISDYVYKDSPQTGHLFRLHGRYYKMFYKENKDNKASLKTVKNKTVAWFQKLSDIELVNEFEFVIRVSYRVGRI